ncbi:hypothetical protein [Streptomyces flavidovirens]|uniref:Integral membrane protein n=1 Tax=Streptomyces flavidovirens TaxID=67298 RepID=A0ABW6R7P4_9ACTN
MSGSLWMDAGAGVRRDTLPGIPRQRPGWAADPIDELSDRISGLTAAAVHPDEIAAILESDGMTDEHIRLTYGREDSFALAEDLFARVPRAYPEPEPEAPSASGGRWRVGLAACLLRGLVFALPGLAYVLAAPFLAGAAEDGRGLPAGTGVLLAGTLTGWAWNQALAHRAYTWLGRGDRRSAARALLTGAPAGALLGTAVAVAAAGPGEGGAASFATAQALYQGAATALLVLGRERLLLYALTPMTAGAVLTLLHDVPGAGRLALLAASGVAVLTLAAREVLRAGGDREVRRWCADAVRRGGRTRRENPARRATSNHRATSAPPAFEERGLGPSPHAAEPQNVTAGRGGVGKESFGPPPGAGPRPSAQGGADAPGVQPGPAGNARQPQPGPVPGAVAGPSLLRSLPYGVFGFATGVLVLHAVLQNALAGGVSGVVAAPGAVALTLSMGPAEWLLYRFRRVCDAALRGSATHRSFRRAATVTLAQCLSGYLAVLLALLAATTLLWLGAPLPDAARATGLLLTGVMLWTGLLLQAFGAVAVAAAVCGVAALLQTAALFTGPAVAGAAGLAIPGVASAVLAALVCVLLGRATAHRH